MQNRKRNLNILRPSLLIEEIITDTSRIIELIKLPKWARKLLLDIINNLKALRVDLMESPELINVDVKHYCNEAYKKDSSVHGATIFVPFVENPDMGRLIHITLYNLLNKSKNDEGR